MLDDLGSRQPEIAQENYAGSQLRHGLYDLLEKENSKKAKACKMIL
jgi:hypothetical protein